MLLPLFEICILIFYSSDVITITIFVLLYIVDNNNIKNIIRIIILKNNI